MKRSPIVLGFLFCLAGTAQAQVNVSPAALDFGVVMAATGGKSLNLQMTNSTAFKMTVTPTAPNQPFSVRSTPVDVPAGTSKQLQVSLPSSTAPGNYSARLVLNFKFQLAAGVTLPPNLAAPREVKLSAVVASPPTFEPALLDFGVVPFGQSKSLTANLKNSLVTALSCNSSISTGNIGGTTLAVSFAAAPTAVTVAPNGQSPITFTFTPTQSDQCAASNAQQLPRGLLFTCANGTASPKVTAKATTPPLNRISLKLDSNIRDFASVLVKDPTDPCVPPSHQGIVAACQPAGQGGGAFGGTVSTSGGCSEGLVVTGHQVTITVTNPLNRFQQFKNGTGSAAACNGRTSPTCSFTMTQPSSLFMQFSP